MVERPLNHYPAALFVGAPPEFTCESVCFNILKDAVSCTEGHTVCRGCVDKLRSKECPVCKEKLQKLVPVRAVNEAVAKAEVRCYTRLDADGNLVDDENDDSVVAAAAAAARSSSSSSSSSGSDGGDGGGEREQKKANIDVCDWVGPLKDAEEHFKTCPYAGVRCPHIGCNALVARRDLPEHQGTCEYRKEPCKWAGCGSTFTIVDLAAHESACVKREVDCPNPGCDVSRIVFDVLVAHRRTCQFETVACPFAGVGCKERVLRKDVDAHEEASMKSHNRLLLAEVHKLRQEASTTNTEVARHGKEVLAMKGVATVVRALQQEVGTTNTEVVRHGKEVLAIKGVATVVRALQQEVSTLKEKVARSEKTILVVGVKHAELMRAGLDIYSEKRVVDGRTFRLNVKMNTDHYGVFLSCDKGPLPCEVKYTHELVHHDGKAASAKVWSSEYTYEAHCSWGCPIFVPKADLANAATSPYVKNGYVTFKCTFEVVE